MNVVPVTLEGIHVRLEPLGWEHLEDLCAVGRDEDLWGLTTSRAATPEEMREYVAEALKGREAGTALPFATRDRATGRIVGSTRFGNIDRRNRRVEIGWTWLAKPWQRTGINTEAKYLMLRHAFEAMGCVRVELKTDALNEQSRRAILRIGAKEEGTLRRHMITWSGRWRDTVYFSILDAEWPDVGAGLERRLAPTGA